MADRPPVAENRRARFDIAVEETLEAGLALTSAEIKSIRAKRIQLTGAYVKLLKQDQKLPQPVLIGMHLSQAEEPERSRSLLLHAREINYLVDELSVKGKTAVPLSVYLKRGWAKVLIGVGSGRKQRDKRQLLRERDLEREAQTQSKYKSR